MNDDPPQRDSRRPARRSTPELRRSRSPPFQRSLKENVFVKSDKQAKYEEAGREYPFWKPILKELMLGKYVEVHPDGKTAILPDGNKLTLSTTDKCYRVGGGIIQESHSKVHRPLEYNRVDKEAQGWTPLSHTGADIKDILLKLWKVPFDNWSDDRKEASRDLSRLWARQQNPDLPAVADQDTFDNYADALDGVFFNGQLVDHCGLVIMKGEDLNAMFGGPCYGATFLSPRGQSFCIIRLSNLKDYTDLAADETKRRAFMFWTLAHEMLHAVFNVYECNGYQCHTLENVIQGEGIYGHGPNWQALATELEWHIKQLPFWDEIDMEPYEQSVGSILGVGAAAESEQDRAVERWDKVFPGKPFPGSPAYSPPERVMDLLESVEEDESSDEE